MIISHPIEKCKVFKGQVLQPVKGEKIILDEEDNEPSNYSSIEIIGKMFQQKIWCLEGRLPSYHCKFHLA